MNSSRQQFSSSIASFLRKNVSSLKQISLKVQNLDPRIASNLQVTVDLLSAKIESFNNSRDIGQIEDYLSDFYQQRIISLTSQYNQLIVKTNALERQNRGLKEDLTIKSKIVDQKNNQISNVTKLQKTQQFNLQEMNYQNLLRKNQDLLKAQFQQIYTLNQALGSAEDEKKAIRQKALQKLAFFDAKTNEAHQTLMWKVKFLEQEKQHSDQIIRRLDGKILELHQSKQQWVNEMNFKHQELKVLTKRVYKLTHQLEAKKKQNQRQCQINRKVQTQLIQLKNDLLCGRQNIENTHEIWNNKVAEKLQIIQALEKQVLCQQMIISQLNQKMQQAQKRLLRSEKQRQSNYLQFEEALRSLQQKQLAVAQLSSKLEKAQRVKRNTINEKENRQKLLEQSQKQINSLKNQLQLIKMKHSEKLNNLQQQKKQVGVQLNRQFENLRQLNYEITSENKRAQQEIKQIRKDNQILNTKMVFLTEQINHFEISRLSHIQIQKNYQKIKRQKQQIRQQKKLIEQQKQLLMQKINQKQSCIDSLNKVIDEKNRYLLEYKQQFLSFKQEKMKMQIQLEQKDKKMNEFGKRQKQSNSNTIVKLQNQAFIREKQVEKVKERANKSQMECKRLNFLINQMQNKLKIANDQIFCHKKAYFECQQTMDAKIKQLQRILKQKSYFMSEESYQSINGF